MLALPEARDEETIGGYAEGIPVGRYPSRKQRKQNPVAREKTPAKSGGKNPPSQVTAIKSPSRKRQG
jgi:hypothetical protein